MSVSKFLDRIVRPDISVDASNQDELASQVHTYTHGINSDPLALLAIVISALVHDA